MIITTSISKYVKLSTLAVLVSFTGFSQGSLKSDTTRILYALQALTASPVARNYAHVDVLNETADYLKSYFEQFADTVYFQSYTVNGVTYKNVVASYHLENKERIIVGAHYDVCGEQNGADDNATGVVGLMELARLLDTTKSSKRIDLVAYTLEEPPFFRSEYMGSFIHANSLKQEGATIIGMVCLEMIGYFSDAKKSQDYPIGILSWIYGNKGDFITAVNKFGRGSFAKKFTRNLKQQSAVEVKNFQGPKRLTGIDFSDHLNYWKMGYSAVMITDTAFYRNKNYHQKTDTIETLDLARMAQVIDGVFASLSLF